GSKDVTPKPSTPVTGASSSTTAAGPPMTTTSLRRTNGPQPLRLPPGKLFFGYEIKPVRKADDTRDAEEADKLHFRGQGNTLRKKKGDGGSGGTGSSTPR
ncbi:ubiquitin fusion degradation protein, partial [Cryomyces antarcticus]